MELLTQGLGQTWGLIFTTNVVCLTYRLLIPPGTVLSRFCSVKDPELLLPRSPCGCCSVTQLCPTLCNPMDHSMPGFPVLHYLLEFAQTRVYWVDGAIQLILCHPPLLLPLIFPSIRVFSNESGLCIWWPKYWSFSISPPNEYSGFDFLYDWLVWSPCCPRDSQESSPAPQYESISSSALSLHVQLSHPHMTTRKTIALTIWTFDYMDYMKSLLF